MQQHHKFACNTGQEKKKAQALAKPTKPPNWSFLVQHCSHMSAEDLHTRKMPFPATKGIWASTSRQADLCLCKAISFSR